MNQTARRQPDPWPQMLFETLPTSNLSSVITTQQAAPVSPIHPKSFAQVAFLVRFKRYDHDVIPREWNPVPPMAFHSTGSAQTVKELP